jgi:hypothetical protein
MEKMENIENGEDPNSGMHHPCKNLHDNR